MAKGGARPGAGRKPKPKLPFAAKVQAETVLGKLGGRHNGKKLPTEDELWLTMLLGTDLRIRLDALKYLTNRRDGEPIHTVNHLHDEPIQVDVKVSLAETIQKARKRVAGE